MTPPITVQLLKACAISSVTRAVKPMLGVLVKTHWNGPFRDIVQSLIITTGGVPVAGIYNSVLGSVVQTEEA